jgi:hypothetical protein
VQRQDREDASGDERDPCEEVGAAATQRGHGRQRQQNARDGTEDGGDFFETGRPVPRKAERARDHRAIFALFGARFKSDRITAICFGVAAFGYTDAAMLARTALVPLVAYGLMSLAGRLVARRKRSAEAAGGLGRALCLDAR